MRSAIKRLRRPLTPEELDSAPLAQGRLQGEIEMENVTQKITLEKVSHEERRNHLQESKRAEEPLSQSRFRQVRGNR